MGRFSSMARSGLSTLALWFWLVCAAVCWLVWEPEHCPPQIPRQRGGPQEYSAGDIQPVGILPSRDHQSSCSGSLNEPVGMWSQCCSSCAYLHGGSSAKGRVVARS